MGERAAGSEADQVPVTGPGPLAWLAMRRVSGGGVATCEGRFYDRGEPLGHLLNEALAGLLGADLVELVEPSPCDRLSRVRFSAAGADRYLALCEAPRAGAPFVPSCRPAEPAVIAAIPGRVSG